MKIVVVSDNHGNVNVLDKIKMTHFDADYYFHLGDSQMEVSELSPFISVMGNNDFDYSLPYERVMDVGEHSFYLTHGNMYSSDLNLLSKQAKILGCDIVLCGHTHQYLDAKVGKIRILNPGSCSRPRSVDNPTYMIIEINGKKVDVKKIEIK